MSNKIERNLECEIQVELHAEVDSIYQKLSVIENKLDEALDDVGSLAFQLLEIPPF